MPDHDFTMIETARLRLRRFRMEDLEALHAYRDDPEVARYQSWDSPYSLDDARAFIAEVMPDDPDTPGEWFQFAVCKRPG